MPVGAGDVLLVTTVGRMNGESILNTFHYGVDTVVGAPTQTAFCSEVLAKLAVAGGFYDKMMDCLPSNYALVQVWCQFILDTRYRKVIASPVLGGTILQEALTSNIAATISRFGAAANRRNQGSVHLAIGGGNSYIQDGLIQPALKTALNVFKPFLYTPLVLATLGTIHPILIHGTSKLNAIPLTDATAQDTARVMRRRTVGLGI